MSWSEALTKALPLLYALEERGYETVFVGGCVRDTLLGKPLKDVDIATAASPEQVIATFPHTIPTGLRHGTVTVVHESETYEVTTFRTESAYEQYRRPAEVQFVTSLKEDLRRRDFTINSMAMRADGQLVDHFGGQGDLEQGILRCVGDADARLQEDALRIVRGVRFAAAYDLRIALGTWRAMRRHKELLRHVAMERIGVELDKMIGGSRPQRAAALLAVSGMLPFTKDSLPEVILAASTAYKVVSSHHRFQQQLQLNGIDTVDQGEAMPGNPGSFTSSSLKRLSCSIQQLHRLPDGEDRWAALCMALSMTPSQASELFGLLRYSSSRSSRLGAIIGVHAVMADVLVNEASIAAAAGELMLTETLRRSWILQIVNGGPEAAACWAAIIRGIPATALHPSTEAAASDCMPAAIPWSAAQLLLVLQALPAATIRDLAVKGKDLLHLTDRPSGPWLGKLLQELLRAVALGDVPNKKGELLEAASWLMNKD